MLASHSPSSATDRTHGRQDSPAVDAQRGRVAEVGQRGERGANQQRQIAHRRAGQPERMQISVKQCAERGIGIHRVVTGRCCRERRADAEQERERDERSVPEMPSEGSHQRIVGTRRQTLDLSVRSAHARARVVAAHDPDHDSKEDSPSTSRMQRDRNVVPCVGPSIRTEVRIRTGHRLQQRETR